MVEANAEKQGKLGFFQIMTMCVAVTGLAFMLWYFAWPTVSGFVSNSYSEGHRDVYIRKVTKKGNLAKVWEIEGGYHGAIVFVSSAGSETGSWTANVETEELAAELDKIRGDELVRCYYKERYVRGLDTSQYLISRVERLDKILPRNH